MNIIGLTKEEILGLNPRDIRISLQPEEVLYIAETMKAHAKVKNFQSKYHTLLKGGMHAGEFWNSKVFLKPENIREIIAFQLAYRFNREWGSAMGPDSGGGIPTGATELGKDIAKILDIKHVLLEKENGRIEVKSHLIATEILALFDDFCTEGTAFKEAVRAIKLKNSTVVILPYANYILNLGGLEYINVEIYGKTRRFQIIALANASVAHFKPDNCPYCKTGSLAVKPNETDEMWEEFVACCS